MPNLMRNINSWMASRTLGTTFVLRYSGPSLNSWEYEETDVVLSGGKKSLLASSSSVFGRPPPENVLDLFLYRDPGELDLNVLLDLGLEFEAMGVVAFPGGVVAVIDLALVFDGVGASFQGIEQYFSKMR